MSVQEISDEFLTIVEEVYQPQHLSPSERTQKLRECMEDVMERKGLPINMKLMEKAKPGNCARYYSISPNSDLGSLMHTQSCYSKSSH
jgi:hypothetical protein